MRTRYGFSVLPLGLAVASTAAVLMGRLSRDVMHADIKGFDDTVRMFVHAYALPLGYDIAVCCTTVGGPTFLGVASLVLAIVLWRRGRHHDTGILLWSMAGAIVLTLLLKNTFQRERPVPFFDLPIPHTFSFPSGHSLSSLCFFIALAIVYGRGMRGARHLALWGACVGATLLVGLSRVYLGVHYPSDVIGGFLVGTIWMTFVWMADHRWKPDNEI